ncbi:MAG TPA: FAD binding domain-containing protein [Acidimicrobiales bacterium]|nr:FAD binding domain-containing protein [Acidimicrobiales bacterium]
MPELHRPTSLAAALELLAEREDAVVYGGGTAIQILSKQGVLFASDLVSLGAVPGLDFLEVSDEALRIGPMVRLRRLERDAEVCRRVPLLALACREVANPRVRNTATIGGNLAHGDYRLDPPVALIALDATVEASTGRGRRRVPVREFFAGFEQTVLAHDEVISAIEVPCPRGSVVAAYEKLSSLAANDWPCASVAVSLEEGAGGRRLTVGLGALAPTTTYFALDLGDADLETATARALGAAEELLDPLPDVRGSVAYKAELGRVAITDALARAWEELA